MEVSNYINEQIEICEKYSLKNDVVDLQSLIAIGNNFIQN